MSFETSEGLHWYFSRKWMFPRGKKRETRNFRKQFTTYLRTWFIRVPTLRHFPYYILLICISPFEWTKLPIAYYVILFFCNMTYIIKKHTRYNFSSNHNIHWRLWGLCFWAPDPLILEPQKRGHTNLYEGCDLTKKYI